MTKARSYLCETQREHFVRFPSGCPLDNDAAAASNRDASGDVAMGEVDGVVIEQVRGEMGAQAAKRRKVNLASREAAAKTAADLQAAADAGGSQGF